MVPSAMGPGRSGSRNLAPPLALRAASRRRGGARRTGRRHPATRRRRVDRSPAGGAAALSGRRLPVSSGDTTRHPATLRFPPPLPALSAESTRRPIAGPSRPGGALYPSTGEARRERPALPVLAPSSPLDRPGVEPGGAGSRVRARHRPATRKRGARRPSATRAAGRQSGSTSSTVISSTSSSVSSSVSP